jgi:transcriptional regulator with XRE-family HTH domain
MSGESPAKAEQRQITRALMARVEELQAARGLTNEQLAGTSGIALSTLLRMRRRLSDPSLSTVLMLCRGLHATPAELVADLPIPSGRRPRVKLGSGKTAQVEHTIAADVSTRTRTEAASRLF